MSGGDLALDLHAPRAVSAGATQLIAELGAPHGDAFINDPLAPRLSPRLL
jgi:hypothetical protein